MSKEKHSKKIDYDDELDLLYFISVIYRFKWFILILSVLISLVALIYLLVTDLLPAEKSPFPDFYKPTAIILINEKTGGDFLQSLIFSSALGGQTNLNTGIPGSSYGLLAAKLIKSKQILDKIASEFKIIDRYGIKKNKKDSARAVISQNLSAGYDNKTMTLMISYIDSNPIFATMIVNRIIELLDERFVSIGGNRNILQKQLLESKMIEVQAEISSIEMEIQEYQKEYGVLDIESLALEQVTMLARLRSQLILKEMEIKTYSDFSLIDDPVIKRLKAERDNLLSLIKEFESGFSSEYKDIFPSQNDLPEIAQKFYHLKRDLSVQEKIYEILIQQYEITKLSLEGHTPVFQVIEQADIPDVEAGPQRTVLLLVITFIGFIFSIILAFILNGIINLKNDPVRMKKLKGKV